MKTAVKSITLKGKDTDYDLSKSQMLIGRSPNCDIVLDDPSISFYHALLITDSKGEMTIMDLKSINGIFLSGQRVNKESYLSIGDHLTIGKVDFHIHESVNDAPILNQDMEVEINQEEVQAIPACFNEDLIFIDDEYCDLNFKEEDYKIKSTDLYANIQVSKESYIEVDSIDSEYDIDSNKQTMNAIEITTTINGNILEQRAFSPKMNKVFAGNRNTTNTILVDLVKDKKVPFLEIEGGQIKLQEIEGFTHNMKELPLSSKDEMVLESGNFQVFIKNVNIASKLVNIPLLYRNKEFFKQTAVIFVSLFIPFLTLLLVNPDLFKPKEEKKLAIIYKKPTKSKVDNNKHASQKVTDNKKNTGHKKKTNNPKKIARKKAGQKIKKKVAKTQPKKAPAKKSPVKKVKVAKAKAPVKAYNFKFAANTKSLFKNRVKNVKAANTSASAVSSSTSTLSTSTSKLAGTSSSRVGNLGTDSSGANNSFGSKGLSSRSGRDSSYIQTKTVVLGSMDPELLRKILRRYLPQFKHCYQEELTYNDESIKGIVDLNFKITGSGRVKGMKIVAKDKRFSKRGINCMKKVLGIIKFPKPKGGGTVAVRQPLNFFSDKKS